jgi:hypothetical protein
MAISMTTIANRDNYISTQFTMGNAEYVKEFDIYLIGEPVVTLTTDELIEFLDYTKTPYVFNRHEEIAPQH